MTPKKTSTLTKFTSSTDCGSNHQRHAAMLFENRSIVYRVKTRQNHWGVWSFFSPMSLEIPMSCCSKKSPNWANCNNWGLWGSISIVHGAYNKPTNITGGHHIVSHVADRLDSASRLSSSWGRCSSKPRPRGWSKEKDRDFTNNKLDVTQKMRWTHRSEWGYRKNMEQFLTV